MNYNHEHHPGKPLVAGFCQNCKNIFHRDGDLMTFSTSYSTPSYNLILTIENVKTYRDWLVFASNFCDNCLPPRPLAVEKDIEEERKRRQADMANYQENKVKYSIPYHEDKESYTERGQNDVNNSNEWASIQRKRNIFKKTFRNLPNALHRRRGTSEREIKK